MAVHRLDGSQWLHCTSPFWSEVD